MEALHCIAVAESVQELSKMELDAKNAEKRFVADLAAQASWSRSPPLGASAQIRVGYSSLI